MKNRPTRLDLLSRVTRFHSWLILANALTNANLTQKVTVKLMLGLSVRKNTILKNIMKLYKTKNIPHIRFRDAELSKRHHNLSRSAYLSYDLHIILYLNHVNDCLICLNFYWFHTLWRNTCDKVNMKHNWQSINSPWAMTEQFSGDVYLHKLYRFSMVSDIAVDKVE